MRRVQPFFAPPQPNARPMLCVLAAAASLAVAAAAPPTADRPAIMALRAAIAAQRPAWADAHWPLATNATLCTSWRGIRCSSDDAHIVSIAMVDAGVAEIPPVMANLTALGGLDLSGNAIGNLDAVVDVAPRLRLLNASANGVEYLSSRVAELVDLTVLVLADNGLRTVPRALGSLRHLEELNLAGNALTALPVDELSVLPNLTRLVLARNPGLGLSVALTDLCRRPDLDCMLPKQEPVRGTSKGDGDIDAIMAGIFTTVGVAFVAFVVVRTRDRNLRVAPAPV